MPEIPAWGSLSQGMTEQHTSWFAILATASLRPRVLQARRVKNLCSSWRTPAPCPSHRCSHAWGRPARLWPLRSCCKRWEQGQPPTALPKPVSALRAALPLRACWNIEVIPWHRDRHPLPSTTLGGALLEAQLVGVSRTATFACGTGL